MNRILCIGTITAAALLAGCGSDEPPITAEAASALGDQVANARAVVAVGDYEQAAGLLDQIDVSVADLRESGELSGPHAEDVTAAVGDVRTALASYVATTTTTTTTTAPPRTTTTEPDDEDNGNNGNGNNGNGNNGNGNNGNGNGNGGGDGEDDD